MVIILEKKYAAVPSPSTLRRAGTVVANVWRGLNKNGAARKKLVGAAAMGTSMAAVGYGVDKAIQADKKRLTGETINLPPEEAEELKKKRAAKYAVLTAVPTATSVVVAARHGALGKTAKKVARKATGPEAAKLAKNIGNDFKEGVKENLLFKGNPVGSAMTYGFAGLDAAGYALGERKQLKEQLREQAGIAEAEEEKEYSLAALEARREEREARAINKVGRAAMYAGSFVGAGKAGAAGTKVARYMNSRAMTTGRQLRNLGKATNIKALKAAGGKMMKSGAAGYEKAVETATRQGLNRAVKAGAKAERQLARRAGKLAAEEEIRLQKLVQEGQNAKSVLANPSGIKSVASSAANRHLKHQLSGQSHTSFTKSVLDSKAGRFVTFANGGKGAEDKFFKELAKQHAGTDTEKVANFLTTGTGKTVALAGGALAGTAAFAPFNLGDKAFRKGISAIDKKAYAYEKSKEGDDGGDDDKI